MNASDLKARMSATGAVLRVPVTVELHAELIAVAERGNATVQDVVRRAIRLYLESK